ncbi:MAG: phage integrase family protein [Eggerthellaceae bacterium]|nr:phage integrase family protein [Eggerthellaceae bacterium]
MREHNPSSETSYDTHPYNLRQTPAVCVIDRGMPIKQIQELLGYTKIKAAIHYALVNQNVNGSRRRYIK